MRRFAVLTRMLLLMNLRERESLFWYFVFPIGLLLVLGAANLGAGAPPELVAAWLLATVRRVHAGERVIQPRLATRLISELSRRSPPGSGFEQPTERELEVLRLLAAGQSSKEIGRQLGLAEGTVKNHVSTIPDKLHAANRTQAALAARDTGLI